MSEYYSKDPIVFADDVEAFSGTKLLRKAELIRIYEEAIRSGKESEFEDLIFTAKYVQGLMRVVSKGGANPEAGSLEKIKNDFADNMNKAVNQIKDIISGADELMKSYFDKTYFVLSGEGFSNFNELLSDLEWAKKFVNFKKRE